MQSICLDYSRLKLTSATWRSSGYADCWKNGVALRIQVHRATLRFGRERRSTVTSYRLLETAWTIAIVAVLVAVMFALVGCAAPGACIKPIVQLERPVLPTVAEPALACLTDETYISLALRDRLLHDALDECHLIVRELAEVPQ